MVGGTSDAALRRAARAADVWQSPPAGPDNFAVLARRLRDLTDRPLELGGRTEWSDPARPVGDAAEEVEAWAAAGADHLAVWFGMPDGFAERMTAFARAASLSVEP